MAISARLLKRLLPRVGRLPWKSIIPVHSDGASVLFRRNIGGFFATVRRRLGGITISFGFEEEDFCNGRNCRHCQQVYEQALALRLAEAHAQYDELKRRYSAIRRRIIQICLVTQDLSRASPATMKELQCLVARAAFVARVLLDEWANVFDFDEVDVQDEVSEMEFETRSIASV
ncbi:hypothetical protein ONZ45_g16613 [Pleurotus djamor]|nr:hypothetical protein ONZ45_g16613 [Pleurotus djamor]